MPAARNSRSVAQSVEGYFPNERHIPCRLATLLRSMQLISLSSIVVHTTRAILSRKPPPPLPPVRHSPLHTHQTIRTHTQTNRTTELACVFLRQTSDVWNAIGKLHSARTASYWCVLLRCARNRCISLWLCAAPALCGELWQRKIMYSFCAVLRRLRMYIKQCTRARAQWISDAGCSNVVDDTRNSFGWLRLL